MFSLQRLTVRKQSVTGAVFDQEEKSPREQVREKIARRIALEFHDGMYGILPTLNWFTPVIVVYDYACSLMCNASGDRVVRSILVSMVPVHVY